MTNKEKYHLVKLCVKGPPLPPRDGRPPKLPKKKPVKKTLKPPKDNRPPKLPKTKSVKTLPKPPKDNRPPKLPKTKSVKTLPKPPRASGPPLLPMSGAGGGNSGSRGATPRGTGARMGYLRGSPGGGGSYGTKPNKYL